MTGTDRTPAVHHQPVVGELAGETWDQLATWDPEWTAAYQRMVTNPWTDEVLPPKTAALIVVALNAACTARNTEGARYAIRAALAAGAVREELLTVLKMASMLAIHSCSLGAPLLLAALEERSQATTKRAELPATPSCDAMRAMGQWNAAWDPFFDLDPVWTDQFMAAGLGIYADGVLPAKEVELLSIAFDASVTHMYAPGTARHIEGALAAGATPEEIMAVLKLCVAFGSAALALGVPILADELARAGI
jgi:alkylhydroperoxidase/carboxymuconolactone decarboxylase family protein YurZ